MLTDKIEQQLIILNRTMLMLSEALMDKCGYCQNETGHRIYKMLDEKVKSIGGQQ